MAGDSNSGRKPKERLPLTESQQRLVEEFFPLAVRMGQKYGWIRGMTRDEATSQATMFLIRAAQTYRDDFTNDNPHNGGKPVKFITYASRLIQLEFSKFAQSESIKYKRLSLTIEANAVIPSELDTTSWLDSYAIHTDTGDLIASVAEEYQVSRRKVMKAIERLKPRWRMALELRYGLNGEPAMTFENISVRMGVSKARVGQIINKALEELKESIGSSSLELTA